MKTTRTTTQKWISRVQIFPKLWKFTSMLGLVSFLALALMPTWTLWANPPLPQILLGEEFRASSLEESFREAGGFRDIQSWNDFVLGRFGLLRASWEENLDRQISEQLAQVTSSDAYHDTEAYRDYLTKELGSRKQDLLEDWEHTAMLTVTDL